MGLLVDNLIGNGLPVNNLIGDGLPVDNLCFKVAFFSFESLSRSARQTKSFSSNKADKSTGFSTGDFTVFLFIDLDVTLFFDIKGGW